MPPSTKTSPHFAGAPASRTFIYIGWTPFITLVINAVTQEGVKDFLLHPVRSKTREFSQESAQLQETPTLSWGLALGRARQIREAKSARGFTGQWDGFGQVGMFWIIDVPGWNSCHFRLSPSGCSWGELWPGRGDIKTSLMLLQTGEELQKEASLICIQFLLLLKKLPGSWAWSSALAQSPQVMRARPAQ